MIDPKVIKKEIKKLNIPKEFFKINIDSFFSHDYTIMLSIRQDAGKTTSALLLGCCIYKCYQMPIEYIRNDEAQIRQASVEDLFNTVVRFGYLDRLFDGKWNDVVYLPRSKKFYLIHRDEEGEEDARDTRPLCVLHSNEKWKTYKSSYNSNSDYIILDEMMDTSRATYGIWSEFMNNISTIGRPGDEKTRDPHVLMLGNNSDDALYSFWWDDFCIADQIPALKFGETIESRTKKGTTLCCYLLEQSEIQKKRISSNRLRFFGFETRKAAQFTGSVEWSGEDWKHLDFDLNYDELITRRIYIFHRNRWIQIEYFNMEEKGRFIFFHFANKPLYDDNIILTLDPQDEKQIYGIGEYSKIFPRLKKVLKNREENRAYYESNYVGELVKDYFLNIE